MSNQSAMQRGFGPVLANETQKHHSDEPFWVRKTLAEMDPDEWEAICDGCGRCCLLKVEDEDSGEIFLTRLACKLLDLDTCRCRNYAERARHVPDCISLTANRVGEIDWLPRTCGYRRIAEGRGLAWWHPLVSGDPETVHAAGISVRGKVLTETPGRLRRIEDYLTDDWTGRDDECGEEDCSR